MFFSTSKTISGRSNLIPLRSVCNFCMCCMSAGLSIFMTICFLVRFMVKVLFFIVMCFYYKPLKKFKVIIILFFVLLFIFCFMLVNLSLRFHCVIFLLGTHQVTLVLIFPGEWFDFLIDEVKLVYNFFYFMFIKFIVLNVFQSIL